MSRSGTSPHGNALGLAHHFDDFDQQKEASYFGMWLFLVQEVMFFGGLFAAYVVYRMNNPEAFAAGSRALDVTLGGINTAVLIGSSLTMALGVWAAQVEKRKLCIVFLVLTMVLGGVFLGIKTIEYEHKWHEHHVPGPHFEWDGPEGPEVQMFFNLYFAMTGLHALHMVVGIGLLIFLAIRKGFEPLLLLPIGFGAILTNIPMAGISAGPMPGQPGGFLYYFYTIGVESGVFPLLIFMGVGAMTDFGPLIANWRRHGAISRAAKIVSVLSMAAILVVSLLLAAPTLVIVAQAVILTACAYFIVSRPLPPDQ